MTSTSRLRLVLEFDLEAEPIAGQLEPPAGAPLPFAGWTGLARALEDVIEREPNLEGRDQP
jgi:hypothetical protein